MVLSPAEIFTVEIIFFLAIINPNEHLISNDQSDVHYLQDYVYLKQNYHALEDPDGEDADAKQVCMLGMHLSELATSLLDDAKAGYYHDYCVDYD